MPDFWRHSGFHLAERDAQRRCLVTDDLLRAYFARPEVAPVAQSCPRERAVFERLMNDPRAAVMPDDVAAFADPDAREAYGYVLRFRNHLLSHGSLEEAYRRLFVGADGKAIDFAALRLPPLFADQLAQMIVRNVLDGCDDALQARAGELLFRAQRAHVEDGQVFLADVEALDAARDGAGGGDAGIVGLIEQAQASLQAVEFTVLTRDNADDYWARDERHDMALPIGFGSAGLEGFCRVIEGWVRHFFGAGVRVRPVRSIDSARMRWYVGLDGEATTLLNDIYNSRPLDDARRMRILCMMEMQTDDAPAPAGLAPRCYLALAMTPQGVVRAKPQNLLIGLPVGSQP
ncbi:MAG: hypothetical protein JNM90_12460 [Burkholderiales bacterium]|nr:hypothetical protein [Burkholderiales bacterium]